MEPYCKVLPNVLVAYFLNFISTKFNNIALCKVLLGFRHHDDRAMK